MKLSIITPTRGNITHLKNYFESLLLQNFTGDLEILLCTTGADLCELSILTNKISERFSLRILSNSELGIARARNQGLQSASGEYILFLDDD